MSLLAAAATGAALPQAVQIAGAVLVLAAFVGAQAGRLPTRSCAYLLLNLAGSAVLAALAAVDRQYGFLLLEAVWAAVSAWALVRLSLEP
jgi:hypothetical protein